MRCHDASFLAGMDGLKTRKGWGGGCSHPPHLRALLCFSQAAFRSRCCPKFSNMQPLPCSHGHVPHLQVPSTGTRPCSMHCLRCGYWIAGTGAQLEFAFNGRPPLTSLLISVLEAVRFIEMEAPPSPCTARAESPPRRGRSRSRSRDSRKGKGKGEDVDTCGPSPQAGQGKGEGSRVTQTERVRPFMLAVKGHHVITIFAVSCLQMGNHPVNVYVSHCPQGSKDPTATTVTTIVTPTPTIL